MCETKRPGRVRRRQEEVCCVFREPCFQTVTSDGGGGDEQMYFVHASDRCTRKLSPLSTLLTSEQALLCRSPLSRAPLSSPPHPIAQPQAGPRHPQVGPSPATPAMCPGSYLKKSHSVCCVLSSVKPISFPTSQTACSGLTLWWFVADGKQRCRGLGCVCFGIWL